jgi:3-hydroxy-9,10-secoandrosta-1,3,5(10)-triene-9,17-dione monooxygenase reductase component
MTLEPVPDLLADSTRAYRRALGAFATGVCVMTVEGPDWAIGLTANSFASVSLDPRLIVWSIDLRSERHAAFAAAQRFGVHVLRAGDSARADRFARGDWRIAPEDLVPAPGAAPRLPDVLTWLDCAVHQLLPMGDHLMLFGRVERFGSDGGDGLTYFAGRYGAARETAT